MYVPIIAKFPCNFQELLWKKWKLFPHNSKVSLLFSGTIMKNNNNGPHWGLYCLWLFYIFCTRRYRYEGRWGWQLAVLAGTRSRDLGVVGVFPHISASCCRFGAICVHHRLGPVTCFAQVVLTFICWLTRSGVILDQRKDNSLHACVPSPGLELASAPLTLVKHHTCGKVACHCPQSYV